MRFLSSFSVALLVSLTPSSGAFAPQTMIARRRGQPDTRIVRKVSAAEVTALTDATNTVADKVDDVLQRTDELVLRRAMRVVNTVPALFTLSELAKAAGSTKLGLDLAPTVLSIAAPAGLELPVWIGYALPAIIISQVASLAKSALAENNDELSQSQISQLLVSNVCLARAVTNPNLVNWAVVSIVAGYAARNNNNNNNNDWNIHNASTQLVASVATIATVLGIANKIPDVLPMLATQPGLPQVVTAAAGLIGLYGLVARTGNSKTKKVIHAIVTAGIVVGRVTQGALNINNLANVGTAVFAGSVYLGWVAVDKARKALAK
jgi:hypothetical protein